MRNRGRLLIGCLVLLSALLGACQKDGKEVEGENASLTSDWELVEYTVKEKTTRADELDEEVLKLAPAFRCEDGENCIVSNLGKDHFGVITEDQEQYLIRFDDTEETMTVQITGDTLTMVNSKGTVSFVFRAK